MYMFRYWGFGFMFIMMILCIILIAAIAYIVAKSSNRHTSDTHHNQALNILEERLARGEIDEEEYKHKISLLKSK